MGQGFFPTFEGNFTEVKITFELALLLPKIEKKINHMSSFWREKEAMLCIVVVSPVNLRLALHFHLSASK